MFADMVYIIRIPIPKRNMMKIEINPTILMLTLIRYCRTYLP